MLDIVLKMFNIGRHNSTVDGHLLKLCICDTVIVGSKQL